MRLLVLISILGLAAIHGQDLYELGRERLGPPRDDPQTLDALEVRCGDAQGRERTHCEADLRHAFQNGGRQPEEIVKLHCTRFDNGWVAQEADLDVCQPYRES